MAYALNNVPTSDGWQQLVCGNSVRLNLDVSNASIYYELGQGIGGVNWTGDVYQQPAFKSLDRRFDAIRFKSATPGKSAQVTIVALGRGDIG